MELHSEAFAAGGVMPRAFSCEGGDMSPPLRWSGAPAGTRSFALICEDPDAPLASFTHWVLYNLPAEETELPEGVPKEAIVLCGVKQGRNGFGRVGYGGPCPPNGVFHRYYFTLYALNETLPLDSGASKARVEEMMKGHVLAEARLMARYRKAPLRTFVRALLGLR